MNLDLSKVASIAGRILAPMTFITAILFYYGWQRTRSIYSQFGIHYTFLDFTNQEFILRSLDIVLVVFRFLPVVILVLLIAHFLFDRQVKESDKNTTKPRRIAVALIGIGILLYILSITRLVADQSRTLAWIFFTVGVILIAYGLYRIAQLGNVRRITEATNPAVEKQPPGKLLAGLEFIAGRLILDEDGKTRWTGLILITLMVLLGAFYSAAFYANDRAKQIVDEFERNDLADFPDVTVYSSSPLFLESNSVTYQDLGGAEGYHFRYGGLKLLMKVGDKYFLIPDNWSQAENTVAIVLPDSEMIKLELVPGKIGDH